VLRSSPVPFPGIEMITTRKIVACVSLLTLAAAQVDRPHPYAFERPMIHRSFFSHKLGIPFVERSGRPVEETFEHKSVDEDSEEFHDLKMPERDRTSASGETEIRSKIVQSFDRKSDKNVTTTAATKTSLADEFPTNSTLLDLMTSHNMPVPMSLKSRKENRSKTSKYESLKPKLKPRPRPIFEYSDEDYYYVYDDDDDYYDVEIAPKMNERKNKISKYAR